MNLTNFLLSGSSRAEKLLWLNFACIMRKRYSSSFLIVLLFLSSTAAKSFDNVVQTDIDVVSYGEDCSLEGPFCDTTLHLICDPVDETCICDSAAGFVHRKDVDVEYQYQLGMPYDDSSKICISLAEIAESTERLLGLKNDVKVDPQPVSEEKLRYQEPMHDIEDEAFLDLQLEEVDGAEGESLGENLHDDSFRQIDVETVYGDFMKKMGVEEVSNYDEDRLKQFRVQRKPVDLEDLSFNTLILDELLKYRVGSLDLFEWKDSLKKLINIYLIWNDNKLADSICSIVFDVDHDKLFTHQEYVIAILSQNIRDLVIPKVFLDLIGPLAEENCISIEDLKSLDYSPETFNDDFHVLDINNDGCFSLKEFETAVDEICYANWFELFLIEAGMDYFRTTIDPMPEEMYVRRVMQNERLLINWQLIDKDGDGYISKKELQDDFIASGYTDLDNASEVDSFMEIIDKNYDGAVSMFEVKLQMSLPQLTEEYQYEWLESLYTLYETDEDEFREYYQSFMKTFETSNKTNTKLPSIKQKDRIFSIFDKDSNGAVDEVELKLLVEVIKKYVVLGILNDTMQMMDSGANRKLSIFDYERFFKNSSNIFRTYFRNLLTIMEEDELVLSDQDGDDFHEEDDAYDYEEEEVDEGYEQGNGDGAQEGGRVRRISSQRLSRNAAASNETIQIYKLFKRLDENADGFLTTEDFYSIARSYRATRTPGELKEEFEFFDKDKDGILTKKDSDEFEIPLTFETFKDHIDPFSEEVSEKQLAAYMLELDSDLDGMIQKKEFDLNKSKLFSKSEENEFLEWIENFLSSQPLFVDPAAEKIFGEFDSNCDRFISKSEFESKLEMLRHKSERIQYRLKLDGRSSLYFTSLDLNKDGKVSYNEFDLLILRTKARLDEY